MNGYISDHHDKLDAEYLVFFSLCSKVSFFELNKRLILRITVAHCSQVGRSQTRLYISILVKKITLWAVLAVLCT
jgi:hypothetical protein